MSFFSIVTTNPTKATVNIPKAIIVWIVSYQDKKVSYLELEK
ncbi:hypothetical protein RV08_GL000987 [Enterococcus mundtii]|nr:hypothetical protein RV08_GL000987 [Enterococcus mundtii]